MTTINDNTKMASRATCDRKAALEYLHHWHPKKDEAILKAGTAIHSALAVLLKGSGPDAALARFDAEYRQWSLDNPSNDDRYDWSNVHDVLSVYLPWWVDYLKPFTVRPDMVEMWVEAKLQNGETYGALLDAMVETPSGYWVCEHKSVTSITEWFTGKWPLASQLTGQVWAANASGRFDKEVLGVFVNPVQIKPLIKPGRKCAKHKVDQAECRHLPEHTKFGVIGPFTRTDAVTEPWLREVQRGSMWYAQQRTQAVPTPLHEFRTQGMFNGGCQFCSFKDWCVAGANEDTLKTQFVHRIWDPRERAMSR